MMIKSTSKTLKRSYDAKSGLFIMTYHVTPVVTLDSAKTLLTLKHDGWLTVNTARAMNVAMSELNLPYLVKYAKNKSTKGIATLTMLVNGEWVDVKNGLTVDVRSGAIHF